MQAKPSSAISNSWIGRLIAAVLLWPALAPAQIPSGNLPGVKFEILPGNDMGSVLETNCRDFAVTNQTSSWVDVYVRYEYRFEATSSSTQWIGMRTFVGDSRFGRIFPYFGNMFPGERRTLRQFELDDRPSTDGTKSFASLWASKMFENHSNWNAESKCVTWDYDIHPSGDSVRSEVNDTQRLLERKTAERDARLREVAEDAAKWLRIATKPATGSDPRPKTPGPGELLAEVDRLAEDGDKAASQRLLRQLIADFPDHKFAGYAADRLSAVAMGALESSLGSSRSGGVRTGGGDDASPCDLTDDIRRRVRAMCPNELEAFAAGEARRLGNRTVEQVRQDAIMAVTKFCPDANFQKRQTDFKEWVEQQAQMQATNWRDYFSCVYMARGF